MPTAGRSGRAPALLATELLRLSAAQRTWPEASLPGRFAVFHDNGPGAFEFDALI